MPATDVHLPRVIARVTTRDVADHEFAIRLEPLAHLALRHRKRSLHGWVQNPVFNARDSAVAPDAARAVGVNPRSNKITRISPERPSHRVVPSGTDASITDITACWARSEPAA